MLHLKRVYIFIKSTQHQTEQATHATKVNTLLAKLTSSFAIWLVLMPDGEFIDLRLGIKQWSEHKFPDLTPIFVPK